MENNFKPDEVDEPGFYRFKDKHGEYGYFRLWDGKHWHSGNQIKCLVNHRDPFFGPDVLPGWIKNGMTVEFYAGIDGIERTLQPKSTQLDLFD